MTSLQVRGLCKRFGPVRALRDVSFSVEPGEIFGYLGPNGAGKTTTLRILLGLVRPDAGEARLLGRPAGRAGGRVSVGYLPGELQLAGAMSGWDLLETFARFRPGRAPSLRPRLLEAFGLEGSALARKVKFLSHGTRQKIGLVIAMQHDPDLVILDEPTTGLDPLVQRAFREVLGELAARGRAILFSSHVLSEVEAVAGRVGILRAGELAAVETVERLREAMVRRLTVRFRGAPPEGLAEAPGVVRAEMTGPEASLWVRGDVNALLRRLAEAEVEHFAFPEPDLEDIFLDYYGPGSGTDA